MRKSLKFLLVAILSSLLLSTSVFASSVAKTSATMALVEDNVCEITFGNTGKFTKKMTNIDTNNKTIDINLSAVNESEPDKEVQLPGEVVLLIDNSNSIAVNKTTVNNVETTRKELILSSAKTLVEKLYAANPSIKMGVVEFATATTGNEGTENDAKAVTTSLINDKATTLNALTTISNEKMGPRTNIEAGLDAASKLLSNSTESKKYIILLTDAIPNTAYGVTLDRYTSKSADPTIAKLKAVENSGINLISILINMLDEPIYNSEEDPTPTYLEKSQKIFGTETNPTAGSVYYVEDAKVTDTVTNTIYNELIQKTSTATVIKDIVIKDYFPDYIINNFDYAQLTTPDKGNVTATVDKKDNSITWTISELQPGESSNFTYRLKLKDQFDSSIIGQNLHTNKDVTIDCKVDDKPQPQVHNDKCPIVILDVPATKPIPQTGSNTWIVVGSLIALVVVVGATSLVVAKKRIK